MLLLVFELSKPYLMCKNEIKNSHNYLFLILPLLSPLKSSLTISGSTEDNILTTECYKLYTIEITRVYTYSMLMHFN